MTKILSRPWLVGQKYGLIEIVSGETTRNRYGNVLVATRCHGCGTEKVRILANLEYQNVKRCRSCAKRKRDGTTQ